jgi:hypothetical protein
MIVPKATKEWEWMLAEIKASEALATDDREQMGDACKELREAHGLSLGSLAVALKSTPAAVALLESRCSAANAIRYRLAVMRLT